MKHKLFLILLLIPAFAGMTCTNLFAQSAEESIFDEGAETVITPQDIGEDVKLWAQNTALKLKRILQRIKKLTIAEKRAALHQAIEESVTEAQGHRELLLMRFCLNRALKLESFFTAQDDALSVNYILLPAVKQAILLYEKADLPFLEANRDKPQGEIEPPPYASFTKANIGYFLTLVNMNKTLQSQFEILKLSVVWVAKDILRSPQTNRNPTNANLILELQSLFEELQNTPPQDVTFHLNNKIKTILLEARNTIAEEKKDFISPPLAYGTGAKDTLLPHSAPSPEPETSPQSFFKWPSIKWPSMNLSKIIPTAGVIQCGNDLLGNVGTIGALIAHATGEETGDFQLRMTCEDLTTKKNIDVIIVGIGPGLLYSTEILTLEYFGYGSPIGTYLGARATGVAFFGGDVGIFTNGRMFVTLAGINMGGGAAASISTLMIR